MTTNQTLAGDNMSDQNDKIHIQTLVNPDPDWVDDTPVSMQDLVEDFIKLNKSKFSDYYKSTDLTDRIKSILYDPDDDKLGRIRDEFDKEISETARYIVANHEVNVFAKWAYEEVLKTIV